MGKQYKCLNKQDLIFIKEQKLFFIASSSSKEVNLSPKGYDSLHIINEHTLLMMDYLGSGNRTARDISENGEITLMFNAFDNAPKILRCFCKGEIIPKGSKSFQEASQHFTEDPAAIRQFFKLHIYAVESSCGMGVPIMQYKHERSQVRDYALKLAEEGVFDDYVLQHKTPPQLDQL